MNLQHLLWKIITKIRTIACPMIMMKMTWNMNTKTNICVLHLAIVVEDLHVASLVHGELDVVHPQEVVLALGY